MSNAQSGPRPKIDIYERINSFILRTLAFVKSIPRSIENFEMSKQLIRSVCSIGANANEADGTLTKKEFLHSFSIARREAKETEFWINLISNHNPVLKIRTSDLLSENKQLIAILSKIIQSFQKSNPN